MFNICLAFETAAGLEIKTRTQTFRPLLAGAGGEINLLDYFETSQICKSYNTKPTTINTAAALPAWKEALLQISFENMLCNLPLRARKQPCKQFQLSHHCSQAMSLPHLLLLFSLPLNKKQKPQCILPSLPNTLQIFRLMNSVRGIVVKLTVPEQRWGGPCFFHCLPKLINMINIKQLHRGNGVAKGAMAICSKRAGWWKPLDQLYQRSKPTKRWGKQFLKEHQYFSVVSQH